MIEIVKEFSNGFDTCLTIKCGENKVLLEKSTGVIYDGEIDILKSRLSDFEETEPIEEIKE